MYVFFYSPMVAEGRMSGMCSCNLTGLSIDAGFSGLSGATVLGAGSRYTTDVAEPPRITGFCAGKLKHTSITHAMTRAMTQTKTRAIHHNSTPIRMKVSTKQEA